MPPTSLDESKGCFAGLRGSAITNLFKQAADAEPDNEEAQRLMRASRRLVNLDAHKVLNTEEVIQFGECHLFFGQELDGSLCDKKRYKYE